MLLPEVFDPKTVSRCVGIVANEYAQLAILPKFAARLRDEAPGIRIRVLDFHAATHAEQLAKGEAEVVIGFSAAFDDALPRTSLREERYCLPSRWDGIGRQQGMRLGRGCGRC